MPACKTEIQEKIKRVYSSLSHKIRANEVAAQMFQDGALQLSELSEIQNKYSYNDVDSATFLLNVVLARPRDVYQSFLTAVEKNNQMDAYLMLTDDGLYKY